MAKAPLSEIKESDAIGETAALYDDIRAVIGVPMVNLIFRHMATVPGCLMWAWGTIRSLYVSGEIPTAAAALTAKVLPGHAADLSMPISTAGLSSSNVAAIDRVLDAYGRANPMNLVGLKIIDLALDGAPQNPATGKAPALTVSDLKVPDGLAELLPMADPAASSARTRDALNTLARQIHGGDTGVIPSLYRHFGEWPDFLENLEGALTPTFADDSFESAAQTMRNAGETVAINLYETLPLPDMAPPGASTAKTLKGLIGQFPPNICRMTVLATLLQRGLPEAS
ncbi:MAG: hypothetical protein HOH20_14610 [Rhodospirillaceae bacterium]|nr:hypothetical protein [Rhodospirillaceae bacterium]MBT5241083.1 hypothetical protein [Rhodospirillaceae bacterium]MBT5566739.1 hypothetical protein [Rhodospirillaceae bacterium]MBT6090801.1 hypothetical protein [Rhodospirillaceae bacterium]